MSLPIFKDENKNLMLLQTNWAQDLNPLLLNPSLQSQILKNVVIQGSGTTAVNHKLGRKLIGWRVIRLRGNSLIYDQQDSNPRPELTLLLVSGAGTTVTIDLEVF